MFSLLRRGQDRVGAMLGRGLSLWGVIHMAEASYFYEIHTMRAITSGIGICSLRSIVPRNIWSSMYTLLY